MNIEDDKYMYTHTIFGGKNDRQHQDVNYPHEEYQWNVLKTREADAKVLMKKGNGSLA